MLDGTARGPYHCRMPVRATLVLLAALASCRSWSADDPPSTLVDLPWRGGAGDDDVLRARALVESGRPRDAIAVVDRVLAGEPGHVDARRLRQDVLRERGRRGLLWWEAEQAVAQRPGDAREQYLFGRAVADREDKLRAFERSARLEPRSVWPWLGLAHTLRATDPRRSTELYRALYAASDAHPLVAVAFAAMLRETDHIDEAVDVYRRLRSAKEMPGVGDLGLAQTWFGQERRTEAWPALLGALRARPQDPGAQNLLRGWLIAGASQDQVAQVFDVLREDPARAAAFAAGDGEALLAELSVRMMQPQTALAVVERAGAGSRQPALRRLERRLRCALGDVAGFLAMVRAAVPADIVGAEPNTLRVRWLSLLHGPWHDGDPFASQERGEALLQALLAVGWLQEVETLAGVAIRRWPDAAPRFESLRNEAAREIAFESGMRRLLYRGYEHGDRSGLADLIGRLRELSQQVFDRDVVGKPVVFSVPMVGELVDPFVGELAAHFDRYNRHVVLGRRAGGTPEGMVFTRLSLTELPASRELELPGRCYEVVAMDRDVRALAGVLGGDVAGVALLNHFLVDFDAVREWSRTIADRRRIVAEDGGGLLHDPLPAGAGFDPLDVSWRLAVASPVPDTGLDAAVLDTIRHHERQHLVDAFHYLPVESNLWRSVGLLLQFGLSPRAIEAEMERRAELASLAVSPHTELVLAHIADFLAEAGADSPHHRGFGELGHEIAAELVALGVPAAAAAPSRWHMVDRSLVRQAAQRLLSRL